MSISCKLATSARQLERALRRCGAATERCSTNCALLRWISVMRASRLTASSHFGCREGGKFLERSRAVKQWRVGRTSPGPQRRAALAW